MFALWLLVVRVCCRWRRGGLVVLAAGLVSCRGVPLPAGMPVPGGPVVICEGDVVIRKGFRPLVGTVNGRVWDMAGGVLDGRAAGPCDDTEGGAAVRIHLPGLTVRNGTFRNWPDGVTLRAAGLTFEDVVFANCEDSVSTGAGARDWTFRRCWFRPAAGKLTHSRYQGDKSIQANVTAGVNRVEDCTFWNFENAIRVGLRRYADPRWQGTVQVSGCTFLRTGTALHHTSGILTESGNRFPAVRRRLREEP